MIEERFLRFYDILNDDAFSLTSEVYGGITITLDCGSRELPVDKFIINLLDGGDNAYERFEAEMPKLLTGQKTYWGVTQIDFKPNRILLTIKNLALERFRKEMEAVTDQYGKTWTDMKSRYSEAVLLFIHTDTYVNAYVDIANSDGTVDHYKIGISYDICLEEYAASTASQRADPEFNPYSYDRHIWTGDFSWADELNKCSDDEQHYMQLEITRTRRAPLL